MEALKPTRADSGARCRILRPSARTSTVRDTGLAETQLCSGRITTVEADLYRIGRSIHARTALSCLVKPLCGDLVQLLKSGDQYFITAVLQRTEAPDSEPMLVLDPGEARTLSLNAANIRLLASESMSLYAGRACDVACPEGRLALSARNIFTLAADNLVQQARSSLSQVRNYSVRALEFLHLKGRHQLISAEREVRIDGEHINMG